MSFFASNRNNNPLDYKRIPFESINVKQAEPVEKGGVNPQFKKGQVLGSPLQGGAIPQYKKGGMVKKTGIALVHKGEKVIPKSQVDKKKHDLATRCK